MTGLVFVDTNVLVYVRDARDQAKRARAEAWLDHLWRSRCGRIGIQILVEFYNVVTTRLKPGLALEEARRTVRSLAAWRPVVVDPPVIEDAWSIQDRHRLAWWDALVLAAARRAGCRYLLSEDFQHGQVLEGLEVIDPFACPPPASS